MKAILTVGLFAGMLFGAVSMAAAEEKTDKAPVAACPVMGGEIDKSVSVDYQGGKLYFCCAPCEAKFKANQAKYAAKANLQLVVTGQAQQKACPLTGGPVDADQKLTVGGVEVQFCCGGCKSKVAGAKPDKQLETVFGKGFAKGFAVKTK